MDSQFKSTAVMNPQPWIEHFKRSVGKPIPWGKRSNLVLLKSSSPSGDRTVGASNLTLNVVSPTEQFTEMAKAHIDKNTPKYDAHSVASHSGGGKGGSDGRSGKGKKRKRRSESRKKRKKIVTGKRRKIYRERRRRRKKPKRIKTDIFS